MSTDQDKEDKAALDALETEAKEWDKLPISPSFPERSPPTDHGPCRYAILDLQPGVPESDIKITYRKKSLMIHPDKCKNPQAPEAFDRLKKAQVELMDEKHRERLDEAIADARMLLLRERKLTVDSEELKTDDFARRWRDKATEVLVDNERRRQRQLRAQMQEEGREQRRQDDEADVRKRKRQHEQDWEATRDDRITNWRQFHKGGKAGGSGGAAAGSGGAEPDKKKKKKKMKPIG
ncbi:DnaJ domain protein [Cordyceps militaris CM01]|uniref:DnaJ domain protein n=1 Tax=Cordyceps militaris (strain CM01) TaxID=983644 RepID=G3J8I5_CORMM|nr:DnaJ domain protein [Cordyceps militaris CM01]EGX94772.1 DnaJ domain protein [Cordyceps militaris CM01]